MKRTHHVYRLHFRKEIVALLNLPCFHSQLTNSLRRMKRRLKKRPVFCHHYWQQRRQDYRLWFIISYMFRVLRNCAVLKRLASTPFLRSLSAAVGFEFGLGSVRDPRSYDLVVIGGGSGGISCAQEASANGT